MQYIHIKTNIHTAIDRQIDRFELKRQRTFWPLFPLPFPAAMFVGRVSLVKCYEGVDEW